MGGMPIAEQAASACCKKTGGGYRACAEGQEPPDCDTMVDVILNGCYVCFDPFNTTGEEQCTPGCGFPVVEAIDPDVDLDGDGENDAFTTVMAFEGIRIRVRGISEE
jgi:hypothetical protein